MNHDLYFIPIIADALQQQDTEAALMQAFDRIRSLGAAVEYQSGLRQFDGFMASVNRLARREGSPPHCEDIVREFMTELVTDTFAGSEQDKQAVWAAVRSRPQWVAEFDQLVAEFASVMSAPKDITICVGRGDELPVMLTLRKDKPSSMVDHVVPGSYTVRLGTGRVLWEGELHRQHLLWADAFGGRPVKLAADTGLPRSGPTQEIRLPECGLTLRIFPGLESGRVEITMD